MGSVFYLVIFLALGFAVANYTSRRRGNTAGMVSGIGVSVLGPIGLVAWAVWMFAFNGPRVRRLR